MEKEGNTKDSFTISVSTVDLSTSVPEGAGSAKLENAAISPSTPGTSMYLSPPATRRVVGSPRSPEPTPAQSS